MSADRIDQRTLNRTTLGRQGLLTRSSAPAMAMVEHLVGLQAQIPGDPYVALWSRFADFDPTTVSDLFESRDVVRMVVIRGTIHLVTADDAVRLRALAQPVLDQEMRSHSEFRDHLRDVDLDPVIAFARPLLTREALTPTELRDQLSMQFPALHAGALALACRNRLPLVQTPPRGLWQRSGTVRTMTLEGWIGRNIEPTSDASRAEIVLRYLAAFGPASVRDLVAWSRSTALGQTMEDLIPTLREYVTENGRSVFDSPNAELIGGDADAPARYLPEYDNLLLSHQDRSRFGDDERKRKLGLASAVKGTVLVDGLVSAAWHIERDSSHRPASAAAATIVVEHVDALTGSARHDVESEGLRLVQFLFPDAAAYEVNVVPIVE